MFGVLDCFSDVIFLPVLFLPYCVPLFFCPHFFVIRVDPRNPWLEIVNAFQRSPRLDGVSPSSF
jgi:hypothetical protein